MKRNNIHIMGSPEGEQKDKETEITFKSIIAENFPNLGEKLAPTSMRPSKLLIG